MKYFATLLGLAAVVAMVACTSGVKLAPVSPEEVEVYMPGVPIPDSYNVMARFEEAFTLDTADSTMIARIKELAAEFGADAVIIDGIRSTSEGGIETNLAQEQKKIVQARAVYFPSRHPELNEQQSS